MLAPYIMAAALFLLKMFALVLAAIAFLALLLALLPVRARVSGSISASRLLEAVFEDDATVVVRTGGQTPDTEYDEEAATVDLDYSLQASVMAGAIGISVTGGRGARVAVLGLGFKPRSGRRAKGSRHVDESRKPTGDGERRPSRRGDRRKAENRRRTVRLGEIGKYLAPQVRDKTWDVICSLARSLHLSGELDVECGFPDPGVTGMVAASYWALGGASAVGGVSFRPNFREEMLHVQGAGGFWLVPAQAGWILLRYLFAREIRPLWRKRRKRWAGGTDTRGLERAQAAD